MLRGNSLQRFEREPANALEFVNNEEACIDGNFQRRGISRKERKGISDYECLNILKRNS